VPNHAFFTGIVDLLGKLPEGAKLLCDALQ